MTGFILGGKKLRKLFTGNEAVAEGVIKSGVEIVCGYPGTPSTEVILILLPQKEELGIHIEWSTNEKVAFEIATGAAWAGKRALVTMKMSGVKYKRLIKGLINRLISDLSTLLYNYLFYVFNF